uniref:Large ribosomal subunit protein uL13 n=1 Tax=Hirondellea gigas TaxID=1518452 RepID=A0A2P2ID24_9CRUS
MVFEKEVIIDCRGHLMGRLASIVSKELLKGQKVVLVRTEEIIISGSIFRNRINFQFFLNKAMNTNPRRGPFHKRSPADMIKRTIRGMIPHRTKRGTSALKRLKAFEGVPPKYQRRKRVVIPDALVLVRLKPIRKRTRLGDLAEKFGWHHDELIVRLEDKRKIHSHAYYTVKKAENKLKKQAAENAKERLAEVTETLAGFGY